MKFALPLAALVLAVTPLVAQPPRPGIAYSLAQANEILDKMQEIRLAPDLSHLTPAERQAVAKLLEVGRIFQDVYELQRHRSALAVRAALERGARARVVRPEDRARLTLYRLFQGPIATTLDNRREPFVAVDRRRPGKNVYPWDLTRRSSTPISPPIPSSAPRSPMPRSVVRRADRRLLRARPRHAAPASGARHAPSRPARPARGARAAAFHRDALRRALFGRLCRRDGPGTRPAQRGRRRGRGERRGVRPLSAQPRPRPALRRLRIGRRRLGHGPVQEPQRPDRRLRDL